MFTSPIVNNIVLGERRRMDENRSDYGISEKVSEIYAFNEYAAVLFVRTRTEYDARGYFVRMG